MKIASPHKDWSLNLLAVPDVRAVTVDQLLTHLWLRVAYGNRPTTKPREPDKKVVDLAAKIESSMASKFSGFEHAPGAAEAWLRADLLRVIKRDRRAIRSSSDPTDWFSVARPLHLPATRLRNVGKARDSGASGIVYAWLKEHDADLLADLGEWIDVSAAELASGGAEDLPSYALLVLAEDVEQDTPKAAAPEARSQLCGMQGRLYVEDLKRLLAYRGKLPRTVLVDHIGRLTSLHLGLYLLRTYRAVVDIEGTGELGCDGCADKVTDSGDATACPYHPELVVDCGEDSRSPSAKLAQRSWLEQEDILARYVRAHLTLKKLQQLAADGLTEKPIPVGTLEELAAVRTKAPQGRLDERARDQIASLISGTRELAISRDEYKALKFPDFEIYMALIFQASERLWLKHLRELLDSLFLKNQRDGLMHQPLRGKRRFALTPGMLETLALIAVMQETEEGLETRPLRLDRLIDRLDRRYGILVARPPTGREADPVAVSAMLQNQRTLRRRLRESGLFVDLSDAFVGQTLKPRIKVSQ